MTSLRYETSKEKTPSSRDNNILTPSKKEIGLSICAKTLLAVMNFALPSCFSIVSAKRGSKNFTIVFIPFLLDCSAIFLQVQYQLQRNLDL